MIVVTVHHPQPLTTKGKTSPSTLIGGDPRKNDTVDMKEAQGNKAYTLEVFCSLPIIEGMYGQDWKERAET
ncbi:hypothetical protein Tco_0304794 [Tanacetum coccineum]